MLHYQGQLNTLDYGVKSPQDDSNIVRGDNVRDIKSGLAIYTKWEVERRGPRPPQLLDYELEIERSISQTDWQLSRGSQLHVEIYLCLFWVEMSQTIRPFSNSDCAIPKY